MYFLIVTQESVRFRSLLIKIENITRKLISCTANFAFDSLNELITMRTVACFLLEGSERSRRNCHDFNLIKNLRPDNSGNLLNIRFRGNYFLFKAIALLFVVFSKVME